MRAKEELHNPFRTASVGKSSQVLTFRKKPTQLFDFSALFYYRDCIARVVMERCRDPSPSVVEVLMGSRRRDLALNCRDFTREQCAGAHGLLSSQWMVLLTSVLSAGLLYLMSK